MDKITEKKLALNSLPMSTENENRLWQKFQLEWNFHSNHIEGNTLTYGETETLLLYDQATGTHDLREYLEMKAHDVAINHVRELAKEPRVISEADIRNLNQTILKEPFFKEALTSEGVATRKKIQPGDYKTTPNNVLLPNGQTFEFCSPVDVPIKMRELVAWLTCKMREPTLNIVEFITELHHRFVLIHPFDDGNGRTARLLINYILLHHEFPPVIVRTETKQAYLASLRQADAGDLNPLKEFLGACLNWSLDISILAAKGESITDKDDLDKEIAVFVKNQQSHSPEIPKKNDRLLKQLVEHSLYPLAKLYLDKISQFDQLFETVSNKGILTDLEKIYSTTPFYEFENNFINYTGSSKHPFNITSHLTFLFDDYDYSITCNNQLLISKKPYSELLAPSQGYDFINICIKDFFEKLKKQSTKQ